MRRALLNWLPPAAVFPLLIWGWKAYIAAFDVSPNLLPQPEDVLKHLVFHFTRGDMLRHVGVTLHEVFVGVLIGAAAGVAAGYWVARSHLLERLVMPFVLIVQTAPKISIAPLLILWFGLGIESKVALVVLVVFFPIMVNEVAAIRDIDANLHQLLSVLGATAWQRFAYLEFPASLSWLLSGMKVAVTQAVIGAVVGEMIGSKAGMGFLLMLGNETSDINLILASVIVLSLIGLLLYLLVAFAERRLVAWREPEAEPV